MAAMQLVRFTGHERLRAAAADWDDLWWRSDTDLPTARAELVAGWTEFFTPRKRLEVLAVEERGRLVAGLPLVARRLARTLQVGQLPGNSWATCGELLVDPQADIEPALDRLVDGLSELGWPLVWLDLMPLELPRWRAFRAACSRAGLACHEQPQFQAAVIDVPHELSHEDATPSAHISSGFRKKLRRCRQRRAEIGTVETVVHTRLAPAEADRLVAQCLALEDRGWKGAAGSSVLRSGMAGFFRQLARQLAAWNQLEIALLTCRGEPIAFDLGYAAKGTVYSHKVGYDPAYARFSPGHLLLEDQLARFRADSGRLRMDCMGPIDAATSHWTTRTYGVSRLVVGTGSLTGRLLVRGYRDLWGPVRRLRARSRHTPCAVGGG